MFFYETITFVILFPLCWWIGAILERRRERGIGHRDPRGPRPPAEIIDLAEWRKKRDAARAAATPDPISPVTRGNAR